MQCNTDFMFVQVSSPMELSVVVVVVLVVLWLLLLLFLVLSYLASHLSDVSIGTCCGSIVGVVGCCFLFSVLLLACISCV